MAGNRGGCGEPPPTRRGLKPRPNRWPRRDGRFRARRQPPNRWRTGERWCRETASLAVAKPLHVGLAFGDPGGHLFARELARLGLLRALRAKPCREKEH